MVLVGPGGPEGPTPGERRHAANRIIRRYSWLAASSGGATALAGVVPGLGTAVAALGGGLADTPVCMKLQVNLCICLAAVFGYDVASEDMRHLAYLIAAASAVDHVLKGTVNVLSLGPYCGNHQPQKNHQDQQPLIHYFPSTH